MRLRVCIPIVAYFCYLNLGPRWFVHEDSNGVTPNQKGMKVSLKHEKGRGHKVAIENGVRLVFHYFVILRCAHKHKGRKLKTDVLKRCYKLSVKNKVIILTFVHFVNGIRTIVAMPCFILHSLFGCIFVGPIFK